MTESLNRITGKAVYAKYCSPLFNAAAMDGIAVNAAKTEGASGRAGTPVSLFSERITRLLIQEIRFMSLMTL